MEFSEQNYDYALEKRLAELNPELSKRYAGCMFLFENMLKKYTAQFPEFTDHTLLHSMNVVNYSNLLLRENVKKLNADEIYCYLMGVLIHDTGMGVSDANYQEFAPNLGLDKYIASHPSETKASTIRSFHNDFSYLFTMKYWELFDIPDETYAYAIASVGRAHRKVDLLDENETPLTLRLSSGNLVHLPVLGALIRVADELDMGSDRNPDLLYNMSAIEAKFAADFSKNQFRRHETIDAILIGRTEVVFKINDKYPEVHEELVECIDEVTKKLRYYIEVAGKRPYLVPTQQRLVIVKADGTRIVSSL